MIKALMAIALISLGLLILAFLVQSYNTYKTYFQNKFQRTFHHYGIIAAWIFVPIGWFFGQIATPNQITSADQDYTWIILIPIIFLVLFYIIKRMP